MWRRFFFNEDTKQCDQWDIDHCYNPEKPCEGVKSTKLVKNPDGDCRDYFTCFDGRGTFSRCEDGFFFNKDKQICDKWDLDLCYNPKDQCKGVEHHKFVKNPNGDCQDYFLCYNGKSETRRCPDGHIFYENEQICDFWDHGHCTYTNDQCHGKEHLAAVDRPTGTCASYYLCEYGRGVPYNCPEGLYFDNENQMCNFPEKVDCRPDYRAGLDKSKLPIPDATQSPSTAPTPFPTIKSSEV
jgi:Chitin binding Peritrophin-A domain